MKKILHLFLVITLVACNQNKHSKKQSANKVSAPPGHHSKLLLSEIKLHLFSNAVKKDTFKLQLTGNTIISSNGLLEIINSRSKKIYSVQFKAEDLLGDMADVLNLKQKEDTIKARFKSFFSEDNFSKPAVRSTEVPDTDYVAKEDFEDIKSDTSAVGFTYAMYYESVAEIAWSKKRKKVVYCFGSD